MYANKSFKISCCDNELGKGRTWRLNASRTMSPREWAVLAQTISQRDASTPTRRPEDSRPCFSSLQRLKTASDHHAKLQLASMWLQQSRPTVSACVYQAMYTPRLLNQQWAGAGLNRLNCWDIRSLPWIDRIQRHGHWRSRCTCNKRKREPSDTIKLQSRDEIVPKGLLNKGFPCRDLCQPSRA